jgi:hypothetical protein
MKSATEKTTENKSRAIANSLGEFEGKGIARFPINNPGGVSQFFVPPNTGNSSESTAQLKTTEGNNQSNVIQRVVDYASTIAEFGRQHAAGALVVLDYTAMHVNHRDTIVDFLNQAAIQIATPATGFWHQNAAGLLPAYAWITNNISPYIEFSVGCGAYNRIVYNALSKTVYLTPHYNGYMQITNVPDAQVKVLEDLAILNIGYVLADKSKRLNGQAKDAASKIATLRSLP